MHYLRCQQSQGLLINFNNYNVYFTPTSFIFLELHLNWNATTFHSRINTKCW